MVAEQSFSNFVMCNLFCFQRKISVFSISTRWMEGNYVLTVFVVIKPIVIT